jgi:hypothetical protein
LITDLPESDGHNTIMTVIDMFSQWLWLVALIDRSARSVAEALFLYVYLDLAGFPLILKSDNGGEFVASVTRELNRMLGVVQVFGTAYHPEAQGLVEGSHLPVEHVLQIYVDGNPTTWASKLPIARWAWNTSPKPALAGLSPYQVVTSLVPRSPLANLFNVANESTITAEDYVKDILEAAVEVQQLIAKAQEERARKNEPKAKGSRELELGEHVLLRRPPHHLENADDMKNMASRKVWPKADLEVYKIIKIGGNNVYYLGDAVTGREVKTFKQPVHADRLVPVTATELTVPLEQRLAITVDGEVGRVRRQAIDGRVMIDFLDPDKNRRVAHQWRKLGALFEPEGAAGVWLDLAKMEHVWG